MKKIALLLFLTVCTFPAYAQEKPVPILIATVEDIGDAPIEFSEKLESFIELLSKNPESVRGFIAVSGSDVGEKVSRVKSRFKKLFQRHLTGSNLQDRAQPMTRDGTERSFG